MRIFNFTNRNFFDWCHTHRLCVSARILSFLHSIGTTNIQKLTHIICFLSYTRFHLVLLRSLSLAHFGIALHLVAVSFVCKQLAIARIFLSIFIRNEKKNNAEKNEQNIHKSSPYEEEWGEKRQRNIVIA